MTDEIPKAPDALKGEDWAGDMGAKWLANLDRFEGMIAPIGEALLDRAEIQPGERCLDIGPGGGANSLFVDPAGATIGVKEDVAVVFELERDLGRQGSFGQRRRRKRPGDQRREQ